MGTFRRRRRAWSRSSSIPDPIDPCIVIGSRVRRPVALRRQACPPRLTRRRQRWQADGPASSPLVRAALLADGADQLRLAHLRTPADAEPGRLAAQLGHRHCSGAAAGAPRGTSFACRGLCALPAQRRYEFTSGEALRSCAARGWRQLWAFLTFLRAALTLFFELPCPLTTRSTGTNHGPRTLRVPVGPPFDGGETRVEQIAGRGHVIPNDRGLLVKIGYFLSSRGVGPQGPRGPGRQGPAGRFPGSLDL